MSAVGFFMERNPRVSYHNLYHAVDVMHATYLMLESMGASGLLTELEQLALILSALCHDLDHPGLTNSFQVRFCLLRACRCCCCCCCTPLSVRFCFVS